MGRACSAYGGGERRVQGFGGGKRSLGRPRHRWEDNIKLDIQEVGCGGMDCELAQDRDRWRALLNVVRNLRVPQNAGNILTCCKLVSFSRRALLHGVST